MVFSIGKEGPVVLQRGRRAGFDGPNQKNPVTLIEKGGLNNHPRARGG